MSKNIVAEVYPAKPTGAVPLVDSQLAHVVASDPTVVTVVAPVHTGLFP
jgi:hypothetical protein